MLSKWKFQGLRNSSGMPGLPTVLKTFWRSFVFNFDGDIRTRSAHRKTSARSWLLFPEKEAPSDPASLPILPSDPAPAPLDPAPPDPAPEPLSDYNRQNQK